MQEVKFCTFPSGTHFLLKKRTPQPNYLNPFTAAFEALTKQRSFSNIFLSYINFSFLYFSFFLFCLTLLTCMSFFFCSTTDIKDHTEEQRFVVS